MRFADTRIYSKPDGQIHGRDPPAPKPGKLLTSTKIPKYLAEDTTK
ncbi:hypothetical protein [Anaerohalosphaera lusitana]|nr:hypothetical protein [Anaerohalosphaera lusitana]